MAPDEISHVLGQMRGEERKDATATATTASTSPALTGIHEDADALLARALQGNDAASSA